MVAPHITPTDLAALHVEEPLTARGVSAPPTRIERFLRNPVSFWATELALFFPATMFFTAGLLHEIGRKDLAAPINDLLFDPAHSVVRDILWPVILPACGVVLALARIRDARPGKDRLATIGVVFAGAASLGIVLLYGIMEGFGHLLRG